MHDARALIELGDEAVRRLARRGYSLDLPSLEDLQFRRNESIHRADKLRSEAKKLTQEVQQAAKAGRDVSRLKDSARKLKDQIRETEAAGEQVQAELRDFLLGIPNLPSDEAPNGNSDEFAVEVRRVGNPPTFAFRPKDHVDLGEGMGLFGFKRG